MGKSRSATVLLAYLLWASRQGPSTRQHDSTDDMVPLPPKPLSVIRALEILRQGRGFAEPNEGFMAQLHLYEDMGCPDTEESLKSHKLYRRWMNKRQVTESVRAMQAPELDNIVFEDESAEPEDSQPSRDHPSNESKHMTEILPGVSAPDGTDGSRPLPQAQSQSSPQVSIKCRKCRHVLATTPFIIEHRPPPHRDPASEQRAIDGSILPPSQCGHIFLHPLSWMREVLADGQMEGRLTCPNQKCRTNIGKFAWTGLRCTCGGWETPGFAIIRTKIDETVSQSKQRGQQPNLSETDGDVGSLSAGVAALRLPPNMKKYGNL